MSFIDFEDTVISGGRLWYFWPYSENPILKNLCSPSKPTWKKWNVIFFLFFLKFSKVE